MTQIIKILNEVIRPAMELLPPNMSSPESEILLLTTGLQEGRLIYRRQIRGPARGLWQFERGGGVAGVLRHHSSKHLARQVCRDLGVEPNSRAVHAALEYDDILAACFARLLYWTDANTLPKIGESKGAWDCYIRNWRPGKPHPHTWDDFYQQAVHVVTC